MTTASYTTAWSHDTDSAFRTWGSAFSAALDSLGTFPRTADSGQINWTTVARPTSAVSAGYEIRYLNDSLNGTAPIYVKLEFGSGNTATNSPAWWITVGKGSDGAGNLTGIFYVRQAGLGNSTAISNTSTAWPTYACAVDGCVWWSLKNGGFATTRSGFWQFCIARSTDDTGAPTAEGVFLSTAPASNTYMITQTYDYASGGLVTNSGGAPASNNYTCVAGLTSTLAGSPATYQVLRCYAGYPTIRINTYVSYMTGADNPTQGTAYLITPNGTTPRTHISMGAIWSSGDRPGFIWE